MFDPEQFLSQAMTKVDWSYEVKVRSCVNERFNDALTLGCVAGARTTTAALGAVEETIQSNVPSMGYTITYAIGNTLLIIWGVVIVLLIA